MIDDLKHYRAPRERLAFFLELCAAALLGLVMCAATVAILSLR